MHSLDRTSLLAFFVLALYAQFSLHACSFTVQLKSGMRRQAYNLTAWPNG